MQLGRAVTRNNRSYLKKSKSSVLKCHNAPYYYLLVLILINCTCFKCSQATKDSIDLKKLQQVLNYNPEILQSVNKLNFGSTFDSDVRRKLKHKGGDGSSSKDEEENSVAGGNQLIPYYSDDKTLVYKPPAVKENIVVQNPYESEAQTKKLFWKKLNIPEGSSLSLAIQVSRPDWLPGVFNQEDGIVLDAVIEIPLWFDLDVYAKHVYESVKPKPPGLGLPVKPPAADAPKDPEKARILGYERCYLYDQLEALTAQTLEMPQSTAHACILRAICELHSLVRFRPEYMNASVLFELLMTFLTPSSGADDDCFGPYIRAERSGKEKTLCYSYSRECPISLASLMLSNFVTG